MKITKRVLSIILSLLMIAPVIPFSAITAQAEDVPSSAYWQIMASTDFTQTSWSGSGSSYYTSSSPTSEGGNPIGWNLEYANNVSDTVIVNGKGVNFPYTNNSDRMQGMLYMSSYNNQTSNTIFNGVDNFKIDLAFSFLGTAKCNTGYNLDGTRNDVPLLKLAKENKYSFTSRYNHQNNYFIQTMWGERSVDDDDYYVDGGTTETQGTTTGGKYAITTKDNNSNSVFNTNATYHYVVYVADKMLGSYVTDDSGNVVVNYNPIELGDYSMTPADITSIYLGASEFNWVGHYDIENVAYKSINIYKGVDSSTYDSTRDKFLYAYFTGNDAAGETMHYAISADGLNFEPVSSGAKVWNPDNSPASGIYPAEDGAPYADSVTASEHVRDSYAFIGHDGKDYIISTDLNTNNGDWGNIQNSSFLVWKMDDFADIPNTKPWIIDTANIPGMDSVIGATSSNRKTVKKAWAPQVIWDADVGKYMLYWAVGADGIDTQLYYTYTSDLKSDFTTPKRLLYPDFDGAGITNHIDGDIVYHNGLYYCYFKNEDSTGTGAKKIWYAVSPHANGPYTDFELVNTSYVAEGPQVYEIANGSYMLMLDGYGDGTYHLYSANSPYSFNMNNESSSNITSMAPRHGSIVRITTAEYNKLKKLKVGSEVRYQWETDFSTGSDGSTRPDSAGHDYIVAWVGSGISTGNGVLNLNDAGVYVTDADVRNYISSGVYTVDFTYKNNITDNPDVNNTIFSISKGNAVENYLRFAADGTLFINNTAVFVSDQTRSAALSAAVKDRTNFHRYTITSDGVITSLLVDGEFICGAIDPPDMQNDLWLTFGWGRFSTYENWRYTAQYGQVIFSNVSTPTDHEDEFYNTLKPNNVQKGTFTKVAYHFDDAATGGYSNVVYAQKGESQMYDPSDYAQAGDTYYKLFIPRTTVLVYDGVNTVSSPIVAEIKNKASWLVSKQKICYIASTNGTMYFDNFWKGYHDTDWKKWPTTTTNQFGYLTSQGRNNEFEATNSTPRFWRNQLVYHGSGNTTDYYEKFNNLTFTAMGYYSNWGDNTKTADFTPEFNNYVINYKPVYDILNGTTKIPNTNTTISSLFNSDTENRWMYTKESYDQALYAMYLLVDCNPNNYLSGVAEANVETQVIACGKAIKKALEEFNKISLVKNNFNITYRMADGTTKAEVVTAGDNLASVPSKTADFHIFDTYTHSKNNKWYSVTHDSVPSGASAYNPDVTPATSVMPKANTVYTEKGTVEDCETNHTAASGDKNGFTSYNCSICGYVNETDVIWDPHTQEWAAYEEEAAEIADNTDDTQYTTSSRADYKTACDEITDAVTVEDEEKSKAYIDRQTTALDTAKRILNHVADFSALDSTVTTPAKVTARNSNNYNSGAQLYTYNSWINYAGSFDSGLTYHNYDAATRADTPMYAVDANNYVTSNLSADQTNINTYNTNIGTYYDALTPVDAKSCYDTFDAAYAVVNAINTDKYNAAGLAKLNEAKSNLNNVYKVLTAEEAATYNRYTNGNFAAGARIKNTAENATDPYTTAMLDAAGDLEDSTKLDTYVKKFGGTVTVVDSDDTVITPKTALTNKDRNNSTDFYYGDTYEVAIPEAAQGKSVISVTYTDTNGVQVGSQKVSYNGEKFTKNAINNMEVTIKLTDKSNSGDDYKVQIKDVYNNVVNTLYVSRSNLDSLINTANWNTNSTLTFGSESVSASAMPFFRFEQWKYSKNDAEKTASFRPYYVASSIITLNITGADDVSGATRTDEMSSAYTAELDSHVTITKGGAYGWATVSPENPSKYQIASYGESIDLYAVTTETFYPITKSGSNYVVNGATLSASNVDAKFTVDYNANEILAQKLDNKLPFISLISVDTVTNTNNKFSSGTAYLRVTENAKKYTDVGVLATSKAANMTDAGMVIGTTQVFKTSTVLPTGQFTYTISTNRDGFPAIGFRGYVAYDLTYSGKKLNVSEYSDSIATRQPQA